MTSPYCQDQPLHGRTFSLDEEGARGEYCARLLRSLGAEVTTDTVGDDLDICADWASSGLIPLTGRAGSLLQGPAAIPSAARGALDALQQLVPQACLRDLDGARLLSERAACLQLQGQGSVSANGSCHLLRASDGWIALNLAREEDWQLMQAWLKGPTIPPDWDTLAASVQDRNVAWLVARGRLMGLPVAAAVAPPAAANTWFVTGERCPSAELRDRAPLVVDLSSLWAGPLCSHLLQKTGARVIKVESKARPDGARRGNKAFYNLLNGGKESVVFDLGQERGVQQLLALLSQADIVIEGSRPRALKQLGIDAQYLVSKHPGLTWVSITGYGRSPPEADWVAFGDDAAVAAGVAAATAEPPLFCGDALADPLTGMHAALAATAFWQSGGGVLLDINLRDVTAHCLGFHAGGIRGEVVGVGTQLTLQTRDQSFEVCFPSVRKTQEVAAICGGDSEKIAAEFSLPC